MTNNLATIKVSTLKGVGTKLDNKLSKLGITSIQDILFHLPFRYEDRTRVTPIRRVRPGESFVLEGEVTACELVFGRRRSLLVRLQDATGSINLRFYHFSTAQQHNLTKIGAIRCFGEVRAGASGYEIYHPEYTALSQAQAMDDALTPVYPTTEGITQFRFRHLATQALAHLEAHAMYDIFEGKVFEGKVLEKKVWGKEALEKPATAVLATTVLATAVLATAVDPALLHKIAQMTAMNINQAVRYLHRPPPDANTEALMSGIHPVQAKLAFEELVAHHTSLRITRNEMQKLNAPQLKAPGALYAELHSSLGFELTNAQMKVSGEVAQDMLKPQPALRLIQGDVGSGKTVIAALAAIHAHENNLQTALMAPTELLAEQHFITLSIWLNTLGINTALLSASVTGKKRQQTLADVASGGATVIIGTHALIQQQVEFKHLGLIIVDEQHRFGVHQRLALREKNNAFNELPHQLVMTATPIPRTLSMSIYADMDCSTIDELPPGRKPVTTTVLADSRRDAVIKRVAAACNEGAQAYWVCTLIDESELVQCQAAEATAKELKKRLPGLRIGLIHGRMNSTEKTSRMNEFKQAQLDLLVATTVIEVGVDVPAASLMVIENSERLGLAQLHQLRGRVGRGAATSHCVLLFKKPLGAMSKQRLEVMRDSNDGFYIAEKDLEIRGPGEMSGTRQSGSLQFKIADLLRDKAMLPAVKQASIALLAEDPAAADMLVKRWLMEPELLGQL